MGGIDIAENLFPNIITVLTQLSATFVIYILYKKFLHESVVDYLERRKAKMAEEMAAAEQAKREAEIMKEQVKVEYDKSFEELDALRLKLTQEANAKKEEIIQQAQADVERIRLQNQQQLEKDRADMYKEVNQHLVDVAFEMNKRVLENMTYDESEVLKELEKEFDQYDHQH